MKNILTIAIATSATLICTAQTQMTMEECMNYAVQNSFKSARSANDLANNKIDYTNNILAHLPSLDASIGASANFGRGIDPGTNNYITTSTFNNAVSANLTLPIFRGLRLLNQTLSSKIAKLRGEETLRQTRDKVAEETMAAYAEVVYNSELVKLYKKRIANYTRELRLAERKFDIGAGAETDVAQIRATLSSEEYTYTDAANQMEISLIKLKDCMNYPLDDSLTIAPTIEEQELFKPSQSSSEIFSYAITYTPSALISAHNLQISKRSLSIARGGYYPSIGLSGGASTSYYTRLDNIETKIDPYGKQLKNNIGEWIQVSMSIPIFSALDVRSNVAKARNNYAQAMRDNDEQLRTLSSEIEQAVMDLNAKQSQWTQAKRNVEFQRIANNANRRKYDEGLLSIIELQTSDNQLLLAEIELRNSYLNYQIKVREVNYYKGIPYIQ